MKVLIAGCGYVGCALAVELHAEGHVVSGLRRDVSRLPPGIVPIAADLGDPLGLRTTLAGHAFDAVVYAAAADGRDEASYRRAYVEGLSHVLDAIARPQRLVFTSSTGVYGQGAGEWIDETSPTVPARFTGDIMLEAEELLELYDTCTIALRLGGIYGPARTRLIEQVRMDAAELPSGPSFTNRIHRDDCAGAIAHLLQIDEPAPVYLGVDDDPADKRDVLGWLAAALDRPEPPVCKADPPSAGKRCSNARLAATGYRFRYPTFREGYGELLKSG